MSLLGDPGEGGYRAEVLGVTAPPVKTQVTIFKQGVEFPALNSPGYILGKLRHGHGCEQTFLIGST